MLKTGERNLDAKTSSIGVWWMGSVIALSLCLFYGEQTSLRSVFAAEPRISFRLFWPDMNSEHDWVLTNVWCVHLCFAHPGVDKPAFIPVQGSSLIVAVCVTIVAVCLVYEIPCFILASLLSDVFHVEVKASMLVLPLQSTVELSLHLSLSIGFLLSPSARRAQWYETLRKCIVPSQAVIVKVWRDHLMV